MRPALHGDAVAAARVLVTVPETARAGTLAQMLARADAADAYRKRFGRAHPQWGSGTLMSLAQRGAVLRPEPDLGQSAYCRCLALVYAMLADWQEEKIRLSGRR